MSLSVIGNGDFALIRKRWIPGGLAELDELELVYRGAFNKLDSFRNGLTKWAASTIDGNMFLESFPDDGDGVKPSVTLRFIGMKGGTLPAPRSSSSTELQTIAYTVGFSGDSTVGNASLEIEVIYETPQTSVTWISTKQNDTANAPPDPVGTPVIRFWRVGVLNSAVKSGLTVAQIQSAINNRFSEIILPRRRSDELVPGKYFQNTLTKTLVFEPR